MSKNNVGIRPDPLLDGIDIKLLNVLTKNEEKKLSILKLTKEVGVAHKNLSRHIKRFVDLDILQLDNSEPGRTTYVLINPRYKEVCRLFRNLNTKKLFDVFNQVLQIIEVSKNPAFTKENLERLNFK